MLETILFLVIGAPMLIYGLVLTKLLIWDVVICSILEAIFGVESKDTKQ